MDMSRVSSLAALVLAGGKGTRSENPKLPKILQEITNGRKLLDCHLDNLLRSDICRVHFLLGFEANRVISALVQARRTHPSLTITWAVDDGSLGTLGPVIAAVQTLKDFEKFLLILGDTAVSNDYSKDILNWELTRTGVGVFCHPNLHSYDSDRICIDEKLRVTSFIPKVKGIETISPDLAPYSLPVTGALFFLRCMISEDLPKAGDVTEQLVMFATHAKSCTAVVTSAYMKDSGTAERLQSIRRDYASGVFGRRGASNRAAIFLDRDDTIIPDQPLGRKVFVDSVEEGICQAIRAVNAAGVPVFLVTNQPAIAKGHINFLDVLNVQAGINQSLESKGAFLDDFAFCPHHPEGGFPGERANLKMACDCRKPKPGLVQQLAKRHGLNLQQSFVIGDSRLDEGLAISSGAGFIQASCLPNSPVRTADAIHSALKEILNAD